MSNTYANTLPFIIKTDQGVPVKNIELYKSWNEYISDSNGKGIIDIGNIDQITFSIRSQDGTPIIIENNAYSYNSECYFIKDSTISTSIDTLRIILPTTKFTTKRDGVAQAENISIHYIDWRSNKVSIISTQTNNQGILYIPLPTISKYGDMLEDLSCTVNDDITKDFVIGEDVDIDIRLRKLEVNLTANNEAVEGMIFRIGDKEIITNNLGHAELTLSAGELNYFAYDNPVDDADLTVGGKTYDYHIYDGGYEAYGFIDNTSLTLNNDTVLNITLPLSTFTTTAGGTPQAMNINLFYIDNNGTKPLMSFKTDDKGMMEVPVPIFTSGRNSDDIYGDYLSLIDSTYYRIGENIDAGEVVVSGNTNIDLPAFTDVAFKVQTDKGDIVSGITVNISGMTAITDASGNATIDMPIGEYNYSVYTSGSPQQLTIAGTTFTYLIDDEWWWYDELQNIFAFNSITVSESSDLITINLPTTTFNATINGANSALDLLIQADVEGENEYYYDLISATGPSGVLNVPIPRRLNSPQDDECYPLFEYKYIANDMITVPFTTENRIDISLTDLREVQLTVKSGDQVVEGVIVEVGQFRDTSDVNGLVNFQLMDGDYTYNVFYNVELSDLVIGGEKISYDTRYNDYMLFDENTPLTVSGNTTRDLALTSTTFTTLYDGVAQSYSFSLSCIDNIINSNQDGKITLPIPIASMYYDDGYMEDVERIEEYTFETSTGVIGANNFTIVDRNVTINTSAAYEVLFTVKDNNGNPLKDADITIDNDYHNWTDFDGTYTTDLHQGTHSYTVQSDNFGEISGSFTMANYAHEVDITLNPSAVFISGYGYESNFDEQIPVGVCDSFRCYIYNNGSTDLTITAISFTGDDASMFQSLENKFPITIEPDSLYYVNLTCQPTKVGELNATCQFSTDEIDVKTQECPITGVEVQTLPFKEDFSVFFPEYWRKMYGLIGQDTHYSGIYEYWYSAYFALLKNDKSFMIRYSGSEDEWLVSPPIDLSNESNNILRFDLALTKDDSPFPTERHEINDKFAVVISTDGGLTWKEDDILRLWDNTDSEFVHKDIATVGEEVTIDLSAYSGIVKIGFYIESDTEHWSNSYNALYIDNVFVGDESEAAIDDTEKPVLDIKVYPNPVDNILYIETTGENQIQLISLSGAVLKSISVDGASSIDMSALQSGLYLLRINNGTETSTQKVLKR